jgi:choline dehydrogenase-like flavoprotein
VDKPVGDQSAFAMITLLLNPQSRGTVQLHSKNPLFPPRIDHNYLDSNLDLLMLAEANKFGADVVTKGKGTKDVVVGAWPPSRTLPKDTSEWKEYVREQTGTCYHASGTCAMGPSAQPSAVLPHGAVVDSRLKVHGVKNLRVADVSILPRVNTGHTQAPAYMIGEKAAFMVAQDAAGLQAKTPPPTTKVHLDEVGTEQVANEQQGRL